MGLVESYDRTAMTLRRRRRRREGGSKEES